MRILATLAVLVLLVTPVRVGLSQQRLVKAIEAFGRGDCRRTIDAALDSIDVLPHRPEPFELLAYCNARSGRSRLAATLIAEARRKDPSDWTLRYASAVVLAAGGRDPRPQLRTAMTLNPGEPLLRSLLRRSDSEDPSAWRQAARGAPLVVPFSDVQPTP